MSNVISHNLSKVVFNPNAQVGSITHAEWQAAFDKGMQGAGTFRAMSNQVIMGAVVLFHRHSKQIAYLNSALQFAHAYRGLREKAALSFLKHFTGATVKDGKFVKGGKLKGDELTKRGEEFSQLGSWVDWANENAKETKAWNPVADEKAIIRSLEKKLEKAQEEIAKLQAEKAQLEDAGELEKVAEILPILNEGHLAEARYEKALAVFH